MKRKLQKFGIFIVSFFIGAPFAFSQSNAQLNSDSTFTNMNDTTEYHSEAYYNYAKKNIIEDKTPDEEYQGKWVDSSKAETSEAENDEWNNSGNSMNNENNKMNNQMNKMKNDSKENMDKMKNDAQKKTNEMKKDAEKKIDDMNQNSQNK